MRRELADEPLEAGEILSVESTDLRGVHVEHPAQDVGLEDRNDDLGARRRVARDVSGEAVDVRHDDCRPVARGRAANALADRNANAGGFALERTQNEVLAAQQVEAAPVDRLERVKEKSRRVGQVRERVGLVVEELTEGRREDAIAFRLG